MTEKTWETLAAQANYRPQKIAALCEVSLRTLQRHFAANYNMTLSAWLRDFRLKQAYERISAGEAIKFVSYDLGYKQLSHFSRAFKEVHGVPPSLLATPSPTTALLQVQFSPPSSRIESEGLPSKVATPPAKLRTVER